MNLTRTTELLSQQIRNSGYDFSIGLIGEIGAGKTHLVSALIHEIFPEASGSVSSPTFVYHQLYSANNCDIHHFDLYRIESMDKLEEIGIFEILGGEGVKFAEWVDLFPEIETDCVIQITAPSENPDSEREYSLTLNRDA